MVGYGYFLESINPVMECCRTNLQTLKVLFSFLMRRNYRFEIYNRKEKYKWMFWWPQNMEDQGVQSPQTFLVKNFFFLQRLRRLQNSHFRMFSEGAKCHKAILVCEACKPHTPVGHLSLSPLSLAIFTLAPDLSFKYWPLLTFAKNMTVLQSSGCETWWSVVRFQVSFEYQSWI